MVGKFTDLYSVNLQILKRLSAKVENRPTVRDCQLAGLRL